jgi:protein-S-isoprenylcysteine O-methyltransferase Ste14
MSLDIRTPIGVMFAIIGVILAVFGLLSPRAIYARSLDYNVNLIWGCVLLLFGLVMLLLAHRAKRRATKHDDPPRV